MTDPMPVNLAAIEQRAAQRIAKLEVAQQISSEDNFIESVDTAFNPAAANREQARAGKFRTLENRSKNPTTEDKKIQGVTEKAEEDLAGKYNRQNWELPSDRLRNLKDNLRSSQTPQDILDEIAKAIENNDPTLADEVLDYLSNERSDLEPQIADARRMLNALNGREIAAGRNVDPAAKSFYEKGIGANPTELRNLYRDITGTPRDHNALFSELSNKYPFDKLKLVVAFLLKGMAFDLKSKGPSIAPPELMRLLTEVRNLQSILWVYLFFKGRMRMIRNLLKKKRKLFDEDEEEEEESSASLFEENLSFEALAKEFIRLVEERYPSVMKLLKQVEKMGITDDLEKIIILMQYRDAIRGLSPRLYKTPRHRQDLLLVILETLDELEEREDKKDEDS